MSARAAASLMAAILARLRADGAVAAFVADHIHDTPPRNAAYPYLLVDTIESEDRSGVAATLVRHRLAIRAYGRDGKAAALAILATATDALADPLAVAGQRVVLVDCRTAEARLLKDRLTAEAVLGVTIITEPEQT